MDLVRVYPRNEGEMLARLQEKKTTSVELDGWQLSSLCAPHLFIGHHQKTSQVCLLYHNYKELIPRQRGRTPGSKQIGIEYSKKESREQWIALCNRSYGLPLFAEHCWLVFKKYRRGPSLEAFISLAKERIQTVDQSCLSYERQAGLMGELLVLQRYLFRGFGAQKSIQCWSGPLARAKDFEFSNFSIEVKASKRRDDPEFWINGADQFLVHEFGKKLFLVFVGLEEGSYSILDKIEEIADGLTGVIKAEFLRRVNYVCSMQKLQTIKLHRFSQAGLRFFEVSDSFPHLVIDEAKRRLNAPFLSQIRLAMTVDGLSAMDMEVSEGDFQSLLINFSQGKKQSGSSLRIGGEGGKINKRKKILSQNMSTA